MALRVNLVLSVLKCLSSGSKLRGIKVSEIIKKKIFLLYDCMAVLSLLETKGTDIYIS